MEQKEKELQPQTRAYTVEEIAAILHIGRSSAAATGVRSTDGVVFSFQIEPISLGFDLVPIKEQTPFRFRLTAKTALC